MTLFIYLIVFIFGLVVGSFLNSVIYRLNKGESFLKGRSYCPSCRHQLAWRDLIPLLSFLTLGGKCRYCGKKISQQYPLVELMTGILFVLIFLKFGFVLNFYSLPVTGYSLLITSLLIIIFASDLETYIIPDGVVYSAIGLAIFYNLLYSLFIIQNSSFFIQAILSGLGASAFFLAIFLISKGRWLGFGDVKLAALMGLFLGFPEILVALFLAFLIGAIIGVGMISAGRKKLSSEIPFGPFLVTGTFLALFFGQSIIEWYMNFII
ncbi:MAG: hypothetical protein A2175_01915 [Candidatus Nealsonbacteria bacterium RBG_13_42_11]|uniref:Prepilin peptidase n=1 Tax=Candidatus Nealsonbacteria bacterium RBG_13_42_11 TaxID=1801663 RepID=A0A1G2DZL1_9BACT|nr:MAG: hypothetical protein A2175_01915 [Candidatus Nealsonbacteria bacterium RBG_13_42_11]